MQKKTLRSYLTSFGLVIAAYAFCMFYMNNGMSRTLKGQLIPICSYVVMALSLNLVVGISGELSLGHAGFMSVGAFSGVIISGWMLNGLAIESEPLRLLCALVGGGLCAGVAGLLIGIPVLRLRGDYLAIVTLAFGEIIKSVINCFWVSVDGAGLAFAFNSNNVPGKILINGPQGAVKVDKIATFTGGFVLILFALFVIMNLVHSHTGRAIMASRDNRIAAESVGISVMKYKTIAFVTSAMLAGMAGALYGLSISTFAPSKFDFNQSINVLVFIVLGGIGNLVGGMISATVLTILPEKLRAFNDYRMLAYAVVLILVMIATNSSSVKNFFSGMIAPLKKAKKGDAEHA